MAEALYRKYRPQIFEDVVGQEHIERTIKNAIAQDKVSHAYLFTRPARHRQDHHGAPSGQGASVREGAHGRARRHLRRLRDDRRRRAPRCVRAGRREPHRRGERPRGDHRPRAVRADARALQGIHHRRGAHALDGRLQRAAEDAGGTAESRGVHPGHHRSRRRCPRPFTRGASASISAASPPRPWCLAWGPSASPRSVEFEGEALELIAHRAEGGMRNALTSLEQLIAFGDGAVTMEVAERMLGAVDSTDLADIVRTIGARDAAACFRWVAEYVETGADMAQFVANLAEHMRNMYVMAVAGPEVVLDVSETTRRELIRGAAAVRRRPPGAASGCFGGCSRRAEDVHEPAAYLRDRADAHGAPRRRCDVGSSGRARGNPGAPAGRRLCRGCRGARVRRRAGGCSCACVCRCSGGGRFGSGCPCWSEPS